MSVARSLRRALLFPSLVTVYSLLRYRARISPRAEVELSSHLALGRGVTIGSFTKVKSSAGPLRIGRNTSISNGCFISSGPAGLEIGDDCLIGPNATIVANNYRYDRADVTFVEQGTESKGTKVGNNVLIGTGARILDGAVVGDGAIITPNSVVSARVPPNAIVQGAPAKVIFVRR